MPSSIISLGHYVPKNCVENSELERRLDLPLGLIEKRTGIRSRYYVDQDESLVDMAEKAAKMAFEQCPFSPSEIALTILATSTPDHLLPPSSPLLTHRLGLAHSGAIDLTGACSGFIYGLVFADSFVKIHHRPILLVAANIMSRRINPKDRNSAILFADAAGAVIIAPSMAPDSGILGMNLQSDGSLYSLLKIPLGGSSQPFSSYCCLEDSYIKITDGSKAFYEGVNMMVRCSQQALAEAKLSISDIDRWIPHQANARMTTLVAKKIGLPSEKWISTIADYGNSSAATIPLSLSLLSIKQPFILGEKILMTSVGAGFTSAAAVWGF